MILDWTTFTPATAALGGVLIGLGAAMLVLLNGRIAGVSGILGGLLRGDSAEAAWQAAFIGGLIVAPVLYAAVATLPPIDIAAPPAWLFAAGLLVGVGTRYGAGCTSGHGICGLARLSPRSIVATLCFMAAGFATVFVVRHLG
jgi:uncharacterized membrane protein YedE/YeeE